MSGKAVAKKANKKPQKGRSLWGEAWLRLRRNKTGMVGLVIVCLFIIMAVFAPLIAPYDPIQQLIWTEGIKAKLAPPNADHWFGTDLYGRDVLSRTIFGARISLKIAIAAVGLSVIIGVTLGLLAGFFGGWIDDFINWVINVLYSFPFLLFIIAIVAYFPPSDVLTFTAIALVWWMGIARVVRGQVLTVKQQEYVDAARALGVSDWNIMFKHILPNVLAPVIVQATMGMGNVIMLEAALTYLGFGSQPPTPSWGLMVSVGQNYLAAGHWWWAVFPGIFVCITVLGFNLFGDGLRDALDPRLKH